MKRICKSKIISLLLIIIAMLNIFSVPVFAASSAEFYIPNGAIHTGETFTVSIVFSSYSDIGTVKTNLVYDDSVLKFVSGDGANGGSGILTIKDFPETQSNQMTVNLQFVGLRKGSAQLSLSNCAILSVDGATLATPTAYANITVAQGSGNVTTTLPTDNNDNTGTTIATDENGVPVQGVLKSLTVSVGKLVPDFSPNIYDYVVKVDNSVEYCDVDAETISELDHIWFEGSIYLGVGLTIRTVTVTDIYGNKKVYTIKITRESEQVTTEPVETKPTEITTKATTTTKAPLILDNEETNAFDQYKKVLIPALLIVLFVLVLALVILVVWLRKKAEQRRDEKEREMAARKRAKIKTKRKK